MECVSALGPEKGGLLKLREALTRAFRRAVNQCSKTSLVGVPWVEVLSELIGVKSK